MNIRPILVEQGVTGGDVNIDDLMIAVIFGGIGLTGAYLRAEFMSWRRANAAERRQRAARRPRPLAS
jgi:hypothetical protein